MTALSTLRGPRRERTTPPRWSEDRIALLGLVAWVAVVGLGMVWGSLGVRHDGVQHINAAPFMGRWRFDLDERFLLLIPAVVFAVVIVLVGPRLASSLRWSLVPVVAGASSSLAAVALAASDGWHELTRPLTTRFEYLPLVPEIDDPLVFLDTFVERAVDYPIHVQGHPPGATLVFWVLDRIGLGGPGWAAALVILGGGMAVAATLIAARAVAGEGPARTAAPFLVLGPSALWVATSADALFAGVIAAGIALMVVSTCRPVGPMGNVQALAGGAVLALALHLTYGTVPLLLVPLAVAISRRRIRPILVAGIGASAVTAAFTFGGFWWFDGLALTHEFYWDGIASRRPWTYHLIAGNPSLLAISVGPAAVAGLFVLVARQRRGESPGWARSPALLPLAGFVAVLVANLSMMSKGEVERIWLPFVPWLILAAVAVGLDEGRIRRWLWPQVAIAVVLQAVLDSPW